MMTRRQSLLGLSAMAGHALLPGVLESFASMGADAGAPVTRQPELLSPAQGRVLAEVVETILPQTDTPGAKAARVHVFVDLALKRCATADEQHSVVTALDALGSDFASQPPAEREAKLKAMDPAVLHLIRDLTLLGYFTSEVGATQALAYVAVPGDYRGCVQLQPGQKAWATS